MSVRFVLISLATSFSLGCALQATVADLAGILAPASAPIASAASAPAAAGDAPPTFCVFTRLAENDLAYFESWLKHNERIGVSKVYAMAGSTPSSLVQSYLGNLTLPKNLALELLPYDIPAASAGGEIGGGDPLQVEGVLSAMTEDYLLNFDVDEYWVLPDGFSDLPSLLAAHPADIYYLRWVMVVDDEQATDVDPPYAGALGFPGKWMARREYIQHPVDYPRTMAIETVPVKEGVQPTVVGDFAYSLPVARTLLFGPNLPASDSFDPGYLAHFWSRSFEDSVLRRVHPKLASEAGQPCRSLSAEITDDYELPQRMKLLAFLVLDSKDQSVRVDPGYPLVQIDREFERRMLTDAACEVDEVAVQASVDKLHGKYSAYKQKLAKVMELGEYPKMWPTTGMEMPAISKVFPGVSVADWLADMDAIMEEGQIR